MGKRYKKLKDSDIEFIKTQKLFYIASCSGLEVNLSPKGYDSIRVLNESSLLFVNLPGSGNRTYRDAIDDGEFTVVFNAFEGKPMILRLFCKAELIKKEDKSYKEYLSMFHIKESIIRDIFKLNIYAVESSCGMSVPYYEYKGDRDDLKDWLHDADSKGKLEDQKQKWFNPPNLKELDI